MLKYQPILIFNTLNLKNNTKKICIKIIIPNFHRKLFFDTLCLKIIMDKIAPTVPPKNVRISKENSEILLLCWVAFHLSNPKMVKAMRFIIKNTYNITANLKQK
ncbi:hypothetical protein SAMN05421769_0016 [Chryseobacterium scophthalmum]|uniref:Uncharacterized protein n=1 Tax=Chryseobacterium scophthalmum TaxID=59733 RepID=A0A1N6E8J9_9FLAO|nr:hypothetical protein SAMN05421769_0016 [Chryseobacterium scophthalmum]